MWIWYLEQLEQLEQLERYAPLALLLLSEAIGEAARHLRELVGSPSAELSEGEPLVELRSAEGGVDRSVGLAVDVDVDALIYMWVALLHIVALLVGGVLDEEEVVVGIARDRPVEVAAKGDAPRLACEELEVDARLGVGVDLLVLAVAAGQW